VAEGGAVVDTLATLTPRQQVDLLFDDVWNNASSYQTRWELCARYIRPTRYRWSESDSDRGDLSMADLLDMTGPESSDIARSFMLDGLMSPSRPWYLYGLADRTLEAGIPEAEWLDAFRDTTLDVMRRSDFYPSAEQAFGDDLDFGIGAFGIFPSDDITKVIHCEDYAPGTFRVANDRYGMANRFARRIRKTVAQLVEEFGIENVSPSTADMHKAGKRTHPVTVRHFIGPNSDVRDGSPFMLHAPWREWYWEEGRTADARDNEKSGVLRIGGYPMFPIITTRWLRGQEDSYATMWPGLQALPQIIALFEMEMDARNGLKKVYDPPLKAHPSMMNRTVSLRPKDITYYDALQGPDSIQPLHVVNDNFEPLFAKQAMLQTGVKRAYMADKVLALIQDAHSQPLTAEQTRAIIREKLQVLGPILERKSHETLGPAIELVAGYIILASAPMWRQGERGIIPMPPESIRAAGADVRIHYINEAAIAQKFVGVDALDGNARFAAEMAAATQDLSILDNIDFDDLLHRRAEMTGMDPTAVRSEDDRNALREQRARDQAVAQNVAAAPELAKAYKDVQQGAALAAPPA
jgi:hypothetical protein